VAPACVADTGSVLVLAQLDAGVEPVQAAQHTELCERRLPSCVLAVRVRFSCFASGRVMHRTDQACHSLSSEPLYMQTSLLHTDHPISCEFRAFGQFDGLLRAAARARDYMCGPNHEWFDHMAQAGPTH
jgi:hypothetical protein